MKKLHNLHYIRPSDCRAAASVGAGHHCAIGKIVLINNPEKKRITGVGAGNCQDEKFSNCQETIKNILKDGKKTRKESSTQSKSERDKREFKLN